ncbi:hypothetical protein C8Q80DRAFT_1141432 [Daedaleopsis nitida]|nr:hypothetical protein C8Q80DRAFT_1141432 [Daedaleopsis nitida]
MRELSPPVRGYIALVRPGRPESKLDISAFAGQGSGRGADVDGVGPPFGYRGTDVHRVVQRRWGPASSPKFSAGTGPALSGDVVIGHGLGLGLVGEEGPIQSVELTDDTRGVDVDTPGYSLHARRAPRRIRRDRNTVHLGWSSAPHRTFVLSNEMRLGADQRTGRMHMGLDTEWDDVHRRSTRGWESGAGGPPWAGRLTVARRSSIDLTRMSSFLLEWLNALC